MPNQSVTLLYRKEGTYVARYILGKEVGLVVLGLWLGLSTMGLIIR